MSHQDFTPVVIHRKLPTGSVPVGASAEAVRKFNAGSNKQGGVRTDFRKIEESELLKLVISTYDMALQIQRARLAKNIGGNVMTQSDLDKACGFTKGTVAKYENSTAIVNHLETQKMSRILGIQLKNPPKPKVTRVDE